jgi:outer membrane protein
VPELAQYFENHTQFPRSNSNPMKLKFLCSIAAGVVFVSAAFSQTGGASSPALPPAPGTPNDPVSVATPSGGSKVAAINVEQAIFASNEGQRDMDALSKKFEPKSNELKSKSDEIEALKKQLTATGVTEDKKADTQRQIDQKQKALERDAQDARDDFQNQQNEIGQRILQKMAPVIMKYAQDNGLGMIIDTSQPWPSGPVLWSAPVDITKPIVEAYNVQSGVPAPAKPAGSTGTGARPAGTRPAGTTAKPAGSTPPAK